MLTEVLSVCFWDLTVLVFGCTYNVNLFSGSSFLIGSEKLSDAIINKARQIEDRWKRCLACNGEESTRIEIEFDLGIVLRVITNQENYYNLTYEEVKSLYPILLQTKEDVFNLSNGRNKKLCSFRLSEDTRMKLDYLAEKNGTNRTVVLEALITKALD